MSPPQTLRVFTLKKRRFKMCHYHFQVVKTRQRTWTFPPADMSVIIISERCSGEDTAAVLTVAPKRFASSAHFMVSTHRVRKTFRKTEVPSAALQTKINNQRQSWPRHIPLPVNALRCCCSAGAASWEPLSDVIECWMG
ncbi:Hypothetical predicted protein [Xyrichtys novacula]|uniref:Uncharacterized protein n=1 Tax=Xyrichtys novacula TaxID=13765 RepID=A0AAV1GHS3_XYRNO|nr:Hypothetical predicted protein [Xyrichtys novacula]